MQECLLKDAGSQMLMGVGVWAFKKVVKGTVRDRQRHALRLSHILSDPPEFHHLQCEKLYCMELGRIRAIGIII